MARHGLDTSPLHLLHRVNQTTNDLFLTEVKQSRLTPRQLVVLQTVLQHEGGSQTDFVERTNVDRSTLADIVKRLVRKGLLQRRRSKDDARAYVVKLTDEGRRVLRTVEPLARRVEDRMLAALPASRRDQFLGELQKIISELGELAKQS